MKKSVFAALFVVSVLVFSVVFLLKGSLKNDDCGLAQEPNPSQVPYEEEWPSQIRGISTVLPKIEVGAQALLPEGKEVKIVDDSPDSNDTCNVKFGEEIIIREIRGDDLLVEYVVSGYNTGTSCSSGVRFIVDKSEFLGMNHYYIMARDAILSEREAVEQILARKYFGEEKEDSKWGFVKVVNISPIVRRPKGDPYYDILGYGDSCGIGCLVGESGCGSSQMRGQANGKMLYEYTSHDDITRTRCPTGTLFFAE